MKKFQVLIYLILLCFSVTIYSQTLNIDTKVETKTTSTSENVTTKKIDVLDYLNAKKLSTTLYTNSIPEKYQDRFELIFPLKDQITIKDKINIKGKNKFQSTIFVEDQTARVRRDGHFFLEKELTRYGKQNIYVTFTTPDNHFFILKRQIIRLFTPPDTENFSQNRKELIYFFNTDFLFNPNRQRKLSDPFTRTDLAYFIGKLNQISILEPTEQQFSDVPESFWAAPYIDYTIQNQIMSEFPDGNFKPENQITKIEFIMTLVRALKLELIPTDKPLPYKDITNKHWSAKFIHAALNNNLIEEGHYLNYNNKLSISDFILLTYHLPEVQKAFNDITSFSEGFDESELKRDMRNLPHLFTYLQDREKEIESLKKIQIEFPKNKSVVYKNKITIKGQIYPPQDFNLSQTLIRPDEHGLFAQEVDLDIGQNNIMIQALGDENSMTIYRLETYDDLENHWVQGTASKMRHLNLLEPTKNFEPSKKMTRKSFAKLLASVFTITSTSNAAIQITDLSGDSSFYKTLRPLLEQGIFNLDSNNAFNPDQRVKRSEAITAILRASGLASENYPTVNVPFWDVKSQHWVRPYLQTALHHNILGETHHFYPKRFVSRAEVIAFIAKTPMIKEKFKTLF